MSRPRVQEAPAPTQSQSNDYEDKTLDCKDCNAPFKFSARDQEFYALKQFSEPKRCFPCREINKQKQASKPPSNRHG
jgi:hypothetical protein